MNDLLLIARDYRSDKNVLKCEMNKKETVIHGPFILALKHDSLVSKEIKAKKVTWHNHRTGVGKSGPLRHFVRPAEYLFQY